MSQKPSVGLGLMHMEVWAQRLNWAALLGLVAGALIVYAASIFGGMYAPETRVAQRDNMTSVAVGSVWQGIVGPVSPLHRRSPSPCPHPLPSSL